MARVLSEAETQTEAGTQTKRSSFLDTPRAKEILANRVPTAYRLTDRQGNRAYVWWEEAGRPEVDADDLAFRRRIVRAPKKPIWSVEDERDEHGFTLTTRVLMQPDDPRYASRLVWSWHQVGRGDLASVGLVRRDTRQPIPTLWSVGEGDESESAE